MGKYRVSFNLTTGEMNAEHFDGTEEELNVVKVDDYSVYTVWVEAANKKHAKVIGTRLINSYMKYE